MTTAILLAAAAYLFASLGLLLFLIREGFASDAEHGPVGDMGLLCLSLSWPAVVLVLLLGGLP